MELPFAGFYRLGDAGAGRRLRTTAGCLCEDGLGQSRGQECVAWGRSAGKGEPPFQGYWEWAGVR